MLSRLSGIISRVRWLRLISFESLVRIALSRPDPQDPAGFIAPTLTRPLSSMRRRPHDHKAVGSGDARYVIGEN